MATQTSSSVSGWLAVNPVEVYSISDYADYIAKKKAFEERIALGSSDLSDVPDPPEVERPLEGLRIMNTRVQEKSTTIKSPVESGIRISDNKVAMPRIVTITGICDNLRGPLETTKDTRSNIDVGVPIIGGAINNVVNGVVDTVAGYEFETKQSLIVMARRVYENIDKMYRERITVDINGTRRPKTYTISTKGMVYSNMTLVDVEQLNDAEHLLTIPVTLTFEEIIFLGENSIHPAEEQDGDISMGGSVKKGDIINETVDKIKGVFS